MPRVETFTPEMLMRYFDGRNIRYQQRDTDRFDLLISGLVTYFNGPLQVIISRDSSKQHLVMHATLGIALPPQRTDEAIGICNEWNTAHIYPVACVARVRQDDRVLMAKSAIVISAGIHAELLDRFIRTSVTATREFLHWAHDSHNFHREPAAT